MMTPTEILHEIVTTEFKARQMYEEAVKNRNSFKEFMKEKTDSVRRERFEEANLRIEDFEKSEISAADAEIDQIDAAFRRNIIAFREFFEENKEKTAKKMFDIITEQDADG